MSQRPCHPALEYIVSVSSWLVMPAIWCWQYDHDQVALLMVSRSDERKSYVKKQDTHAQICMLMTWMVVCDMPMP